MAVERLLIFMGKSKKEPKILKEQFDPKFLKEVEEIYPRISIEKITKSLRNKTCPKCGRKLHRFIEGERGDYYCVCDENLTIRF